ncbi:MAG: hypothetical protein OEV44_05790, partial [Spirochaetota bacterium]|nr:hypothetical protein [Spirochaetota bacterium]
MIQRMLITDVIKQLDERKNLNRKINDLKKELGEHSIEYKAQVKELKDKASKSIYLEEDCHLITGNGLKKGREIVLEEAKRLLTLGFYVLWISDEAISDKHKKENFLYNYKTELENVLSKTMVILDETNARKPGSTIKYIEKNDLLKQTIEAIQLDGAKYLAKSIFGESAKRIDSVKTLINTYFRKGPDKVDLFDHTCLGNLFKKKKKDDSQSDKSDKKEQEDEDRTNFYLRFMINIGICFMTVVSNLQKIRLERDPNDRSDMNRRLDPEKRHGFSDEELIEGSLAAIFAEYGYLHVAIDELLKRFTTPYYNNEGVVDESGFARLSEKNQLVYDKHCNVSYHFFASMKDQGFVGDLARDILQYHHRGLNDSGYPRRKMVDEKVQQKDLDGNISIISQNVYEYKVSEMSRLVSIINFFVEYFFHTPLHIPFQRDNLVRFILLNSVYPPGKDNKPDKDGIYDIQTQYTQPKRFDAYLVDVFLKSINIYKINERIPIYNFNNTQKKLYDAIVVKYNEMPHRPVVKIKDEKGEREIDLSSKDNESLYIGEYIPSLRFQEVIDNFHIDKVEGGIKLSDNIEDDSMIQMKKEDRQTAAMLDDIFDDGQQIVVSADDTPNIDIDHLLSDLPPELAKAKAKKEEEPIKEEIKEDERISELDILTKTDEIPIVDEVIFDEKEDKLEESHFDDSDVLFEPPVDISNSMESSAKEETKSGDVIDTDELLKTFSEEPIDFDHEPELNIEKPKEKIESKMDIPEDDY